MKLATSNPLRSTIALVAMLLVLPVASRAAEEPTTASLRAHAADGALLGACPLEHTNVRVEWSGFVARVHVEQRFSNPFPDPIEALYTFPLSSRGAVDAMRIRIGDRVIQGQIERREKAREIYDRARAEGRTAALLDQERPNIFTQRVTGIRPGGEISVEIEYVEPLTWDAGAFSFAFPMVVGPRFVPGTPLATGHGHAPDTDRVPDGSLISPPVAPPGTRAGHDVSIQVDVRSPVPIVGLESRLHEIVVHDHGPNRRVVELAQKRTIPNKDFVLRLKVAEEEVKSGVLDHHDARGGFASFVLLPPTRIADGQRAPRELVFVVDRSGSQSGEPLAMAKAAMRKAIAGLHADDTFQIVSFSSTTDFLFAAPRAATEANLREASRYLDRMQANGGTMMAEAVRAVCARPAEAGRLRIVSFMTDGYVGNDREVIALVDELRGASRWFPFGTGRSVNRFLLDRMAEVGGGEVEYVLLGSDAEAAARRFHERISDPVLTDVRVSFEGLALRDVYPSAPSDLWARKPLVIHARYDRASDGVVVLRGRRGGARWERRLPVRLGRSGAPNPGVPSMWARSRVQHLMAQRLLAGIPGVRPDATDELAEEIRKTALDHSILTAFTSFVAVDQVEGEGGAVTRTVVVPVELPDGVDHAGVFGGSRRVRKTYNGGTALHSMVASAPEMAADAATTEVSRPEMVEEAPRVVRLSELPPALARKLSDPLRARLAKGIRADRRLEVRVTWKRGASGVVAQIEAAGVEVRIESSGSVRGAITAGRLAALLAVEAVTRVSTS